MAKFYNLTATSDVVIKDEVIPKGEGTEVIATIAGKDILAPAGGGGASDYDSLFNRPSINGETLTGNVDLATPESVDDAKDELNARIDLIEATTKPNMNIVGSPKFSQGVVSGFSANDYLMFPTQVNVGQNTVEFYMSFTTGADVTTQQNLLDSWCGLAFAIADGGTVSAVSDNGTTFVTSRSYGTISPNSSYRLKIRFGYNDTGTYDTETLIANGSGEYYPVGDMIQLVGPLHPTATYWGGANPQSGVHHIFGGTINLNECRMVWNGTEVWRGYDELPTVKFDPTAEPRLDTAEKIVDAVGDMVSKDNRFLVGGQYSEPPAEGSATTAAIQTRESEDAEWSDEIRLDKGYDAVQGTEMVKLDKSVQTVTVNGGTLEVVFPDPVDGTVRDLCLYVKSIGDTDTALVLPDEPIYKEAGSDGVRGAIEHGSVTAFYFTEIPGSPSGWRAFRQVLELDTEATS